MCGIAGIVAKDQTTPSANSLDQLMAALAHRGPDGDGRFVAPGIGLLQTRLAIIDLVSGDQPMHGPGSTVLVANGEIYNYLELRPQFPGTNFATNSDCELPLHTYKRDGVRFADTLRGMYAIALHDPAERRTVLARDPFGIKPLYYAETSQGVVFASEIQAILKTDLVPRRLRMDTAAELLQLQFTTGRETIFRDIHRVLPGETVVIRDDRIEARHRLNPIRPATAESLTEGEALDRLDAALMDSVNVHQRSDVPYGMFLSGGIDSSSVLACMAKLNDRPVLAFTAGFPGADVADERDHARAVAKALGAHHVELTVTADDFWSRLPEIVGAMDDPVADYAIIPSYLLAERAAQDVKVILSGEGGDELFGGYGRYRSAMRPRWLGGKAMRSKGFLDGLGVLRRESSDWRSGIAAVEKTLSDGPGAALQRAQALDCADWLPNDLLTKLDRCLMANALEGRTPFLDPVIAKAAFNLPDKLKIRDGMGKYLLRRWLDQRLPVAQAFDAKRGFTVPVGEWIKSRAASLGELIARVDGVAEICRPQGIVDLFNGASASGNKRALMACWQLLFYALWYRIHLQGVSRNGTVSETLSS